MDLEYVDWLISQIPMRSYRIIDGDLDTPFLITKSYKSNSRPDPAEFIRGRRVVNLLKKILNRHPEQLDKFEYSESNLEHFIGTIQQNYENDEDVRELLEFQSLQNTIRLDQRLH